MMMFVYGIECDQFDNIIIAQEISNTICLLNTEGALISTLMTEENGISGPLTLALDSYGRLWIGQEDEIKVVKYIA